MLTKLITTQRRRYFFRLSFYLLPSAFCLLLSACHRGPQTPAELQAALPKQWRGEATFGSDPQPHQIVIEPHEFSELGEHLLQFNRVRYQVFAGSEVVTEGDAGVVGTISAPGLVLNVEQVTDGIGAAATLNLRRGSFKGSLSPDLHTANAEWAFRPSQAMKLKITAVAK